MRVKFLCACLHPDKLEYIEPDQVENAILCLQNLQTLSKKVQPNPVIQDGRAHEVFLEAAKRASGNVKKASTLQVAPANHELVEYRARAVPLD